jgi:hypothetical protein
MPSNIYPRGLNAYNIEDDSSWNKLYAEDGETKALNTVLQMVYAYYQQLS